MNSALRRMTWIVILALPAFLTAGGEAMGQEEHATKGPGSSELYADTELHEGKWTSGGSVGFLGDSPDGTALAMNANVEYFVEDHISVGPLLQLGVTDDMAQIGLSAQGKYWINLPGTNGRDRITLQSGIGFAHADFLRDDTSWLVPLGVGYEHTLDSGANLTMSALLNFTDLSTGFGSGADVMPGFAVGLRF